MGLKWTQDGLLDGLRRLPLCSAMTHRHVRRTGGRVLCKNCLVKIGMSLDQGALARRVTSSMLGPWVGTKRPLRDQLKGTSVI
jgi:hypothetical protein